MIRSCSGPFVAGCLWLSAVGRVAPLDPPAPEAGFQEAWAVFPQVLAG